MAGRPTPVGAVDGDALRRARALSTPTRVEMLERLRQSEHPLTAQELADALGVHHTAVRQHLAVLADVGLVAAVPQAPQGRGRPKVGYRASLHLDPYQQLSLMLATAATEGISAREAGRRFGSAVAPSPDGGVAMLRAEAERLGFRPRVRDRSTGVCELVLDRCPFAEVAAVSPEAVCDLHRGIAEGIAATTGEIEILDLHVADPHRGGCRIVIAT
ncbi:MAG: helix-turn-helix domain-containing protein [Actinobacteria bacterium]|nr:helix-turn-helix domain-containing protein [Actinomycetota bacterium]